MLLGTMAVVQTKRRNDEKVIHRNGAVLQLIVFGWF